LSKTSLNCQLPPVQTHILYIKKLANKDISIEIKLARLHCFNGGADYGFTRSRENQV
jgi:hypothetical protein